MGAQSRRWHGPSHVLWKDASGCAKLKKVAPDYATICMLLRNCGFVASKNQCQGNLSAKNPERGQFIAPKLNTSCLSAASRLQKEGHLFNRQILHLKRKHSIGSPETRDVAYQPFYLQGKKQNTERKTPVVFVVKQFLREGR